MLRVETLWLLQPLSLPAYSSCFIRGRNILVENRSIANQRHVLVKHLGLK